MEPYNGDAAHTSSLDKNISVHRARKIPGRHRMVRSAVCVLLREHENQNEVLLMRRAIREGDPWSGHVSFPGGRMDPDDADALAAAKRELEEEVGYQAHDAEPLGRLSDVVTRRHEAMRPMIVTPYAFRVPNDSEFQINHEATETFWCPLEFLADDNNREEMEWKLGKKPLEVPVKLPCYFFEGRRIWGLTLLMLDELIKLHHGQGNRRYTGK